MQRHFVHVLSFTILAALCWCVMPALGQSPGAQNYLYWRSPHGRVGFYARRAKPGTVSPAATASFASDSFQGFYRFPAETQQFTLMQATTINGVSQPTAYYRDNFTGGETYDFGASNGDQLEATMTLPGGNVETWPAFTFYSSYNGQTDCWVSSQQYICNAMDIVILWFSETQCDAEGAYSMSFSRNGKVFYTGSFHLTPRIPPNTIPLYAQGNLLLTNTLEPWATDQVDNFCWLWNAYKKRNTPQPCNWALYPNAKKVTIWQIGCLMTDYAMMLSYHHAATTPGALNQWLSLNRGYDSGADVQPDAIVRFAQTNGVSLAFHRYDSPRGLPGSGLDDYASHNYVCAQGPTAMYVKHANFARSHFVLAYGKNDPALSTYLLKDPAGGINDQLQGLNLNQYDYQNTYFGLRGLEGHSQVYFSGIGWIAIHSPAELVLIDSQGRKTGFDPSTGTNYAQIPGATYGGESISDDNPLDTEDFSIDTKSLYWPTLSPDTYTLEVIGTQTGYYDLDLHYSDPQFNQANSSFQDLPIASGQVESFTFSLPMATGGGFAISGGFAGGGQRPATVDKFLTYANPTNRSTTMPAGVYSFPLIVFYGPSTNPASFAAVLDGMNVTALFRPQPGGMNFVALPLSLGRNVLKLSIQGTAGGRTATDTDRLVFKTQ